MYNLDLFDDVSVTLNDVEIWLRSVPRFDDSHRENHVLDYVSNYDVVNKIKAYKRNGTFYSSYANDDCDKQYLSDKIKPLVRSKFKSGSPFIPFKQFQKRGLTL